MAVNHLASRMIVATRRPRVNLLDGDWVRVDIVGGSSASPCPASERDPAPVGKMVSLRGLGSKLPSPWHGSPTIEWWGYDPSSQSMLKQAPTPTGQARFSLLINHARSLGLRASGRVQSLRPHLRSIAVWTSASSVEPRRLTHLPKPLYGINSDASWYSTCSGRTKHPPPPRLRRAGQAPAELASACSFGIRRPRSASPTRNADLPKHVPAYFFCLPLLCFFCFLGLLFRTGTAPGSSMIEPAFFRVAIGFALLDALK